MIDEQQFQERINELQDKFGDIELQMSSMFEKIESLEKQAKEAYRLAKSIDLQF